MPERVVELGLRRSPAAGTRAEAVLRVRNHLADLDARGSACVTLERGCTQSFGLCRVKVESPVGALVEGLLECLAGGEPEDEWRFGGECALSIGGGL